MIKLAPEGLKIYQARPEDAEIIRDFAEYTFRHTYQEKNTPENMEAYCLHAFSVALFQSELSNHEIGYYIAKLDESLIGFIKTLPSAPPESLTFSNPLQLSRIYVHPDYKGQGIGTLLLATAVSIALDNRHDLLWLGVWQENESAIEFYKKMGFSIMGTDTFLLGNDPQLDWVMGMPILK